MDTSTGQFVGFSGSNLAEDLEYQQERENSYVMCGLNRLEIRDMISGIQIGETLRFDGVSGPDNCTLTSDGRYLAYSFSSGSKNEGSLESTLLLWDLEAMETISEITRESTTITSIAINGDSTILAFAESDELDLVDSEDDWRALLWDIAAAEYIGEPMVGHKRDIKHMAFTGSQDILVTLDVFQEIRFWDAKTAELIGTPIDRFIEGTQILTTIPGSNLLVTADRSNISFLDTVSQEFIGEPINAMNGRGLALPFPEHLPLLGYGGHEAKITFMTVSSDGRLLASGDEDGIIRLWTLDTDLWIEKGCNRAGRNLTERERQIYLPNDPYRKTCPQFP
jgi:WD40 repeat protein